MVATIIATMIAGIRNGMTIGVTAVGTTNIAVITGGDGDELVRLGY